MIVKIVAPYLGALWMGSFFGGGFWAAALVLGCHFTFSVVAFVADSDV